MIELLRNAVEGADSLSFLFLAMIAGCFIAAVTAASAMWLMDAAQRAFVARRQWLWFKRQSRAPFGGPYRSPCADDFTREKNSEVKRGDYR